EELQQAVELLKQNKPVAFPTETVYGLGANALQETAVKSIYTAKGRPSDNPLIVHVCSMEMLQELCEMPTIYQKLVEKHWPGPLTILCPKSDKIPASVTGGQETVAIRMPQHPVALALIKACGFPLAAPSANTSGRPSPTQAQHVFDDLQGRIEIVLDGGPCNSGVESTVIDGLRPIPAILRPGGLTLDQVQQIPGFEATLVWKKDFDDKQLEQAPTTPGMKYRHYSPNCQVILVQGSKQEQRDKIRGLIKSHPHLGILRTGPRTDVECEHELHIGETHAQVAQQLFHGLRTLEQEKVSVIVVEAVDDTKEGLAVMNRLYKAAS
ncbi:DHBP synthase RibB-like alpha/beta domain-containing protein, partial [Gorgonomyces haynaldii]